MVPIRSCMGLDAEIGGSDEAPTDMYANKPVIVVRHAVATSVQEK